MLTYYICFNNIYKLYIYFLKYTFLLGSTPEDEAPAASVTFMVPKKEISMVPDMGKWKRSQVGPCFYIIIPSWHISHKPVLDTGFLRHLLIHCGFCTSLFAYRHMPTTSASFSHWMKVWRERSSLVNIKSLRYVHQLLEACLIISVSQQWCIRQFPFWSCTKSGPWNPQHFKGKKPIHIKSV